MKLIYAILHNGMYLTRGDGETISLLESDMEVNPTYGFESPDSDNLRIWKESGIFVYRKCIYFTGTYCVAVFEALEDVIPKPGFHWIRVERLVQLNDSSLSSLLLAQNAFSSKTAPWMIENGFSNYLTWAKQVLSSRGYGIPARPVQVKNAYVSTVFCMETTSGLVYLKITPKVYVNSAAVERNIADFAGQYPEFIAVSPDGYAALTKEMPGEDCSTGSLNQYCQWMKDWGAMQIRSAGEDTFLLPNCSPQKLVAQIPYLPCQFQTVLKTLGYPLTETEYALLTEKLSVIEEDLLLLSSYPIPSTLCHADIRPGNIRVTENSDFLYDWGLAFWGHPFYDLLHFLHVLRKQLSELEYSQITTAYLSQWSSFADDQTLAEALTYTERCMDFFMLSADFRWIFDIVNRCDGMPLKGTIDHWMLSRRLYYFLRGLHKFISQ